MQLFFFFFFNDTATTEIYTLSLHDALPICDGARGTVRAAREGLRVGRRGRRLAALLPPVTRQLHRGRRSEEHTSELQSQSNLVCRLLLEKKKQQGRHDYLRRITLTHQSR